MSEPKGRTQGGIFSLDGIHPTTIGYGIMAQELIKIMQLAGVQFYQDNGQPRKGEIKIDFDRLIKLDTLISNPPRNVSSVFKLIEWFDRNFNLMSGLLKSNF
jgi:hypothetical protein